jgi:hypothetical protein
MLPGAGMGQPAFAPSFEEDSSASGARYIWRNSGIAISLTSGGTLAITPHTRAETRIDFTGASVRSEPHGEVASESKTIYYLGAPGAWRTASHFERVRYSGIYPGIDLEFVVDHDQLEYNFEISPHADPGVIRIHYAGSIGSLTPAGDLKIRANGATIIQPRPRAFQNVAGRERRVECRFHLTNDHEADLRLGAYDPNEALFIDPVLNFSTYLGGSSYDSINAATADAQGNLYVAGETNSGSLTNPSTAPRASRDAFVAKLNSAGTQVFSVYLGAAIMIPEKGSPWIHSETSM